jgi:hypothetical protein
MSGRGRARGRRAPVAEEVIVKDIRMSFISMVIFMVKWVVASIPAFMILVGLAAAASVLLSGLLQGLLGGLTGGVGPG